jgi:acetylornithine deacetylase/succinyl-diaminopimelate desuccinylase-like protein
VILKNVSRVCGTWIYIPSLYLTRRGAAYALGIPTIGFSPCDELLAHVIDEYVEIEAMIMAAKVYAAMILKLAG